MQWLASTVLQSIACLSADLGFLVPLKKSDQSFRPLNYQWIHLIRKYIQVFFDVVFGDVSYF
jgi:hypothetical protein